MILSAFLLAAAPVAEHIPESHDCKSEAPLDNELRLTSEDIDSAQMGFDPQTGQPVINISFSKIGNERFKKIQQGRLRQAISLCFNGKLLSHPTLWEYILDDEVQISGGFTVEEATSLVVLLNAPVSGLDQSEPAKAATSSILSTPCDEVHSIMSLYQEVIEQITLVPDDIKSAKAIKADEQNLPKLVINDGHAYFVQVTVTESGKAKFKAVSKTSFGKKVAIFMHDILLTAPYFNSGMLSDSMVLTQFTKEHAEEIVARMKGER